jgi:hypothetical protein
MLTHGKSAPRSTSRSNTLKTNSDERHTNHGSSPDDVVGRGWRAITGQVRSTDDHDDGGKNIRQIGEVTEKIDYAETVLELDNELRADRRQR